MKKTITALTIALSISTAQARTITPQQNNYSSGYSTGYSVGYNNGKNDAYNNTARAVVIIGAVAIATVAVYHLGKNSRWTASENGIGYKF